jgi:hypothetical protein
LALFQQWANSPVLLKHPGQKPFLPQVPSSGQEAQGLGQKNRKKNVLRLIYNHLCLIIENYF